MAADLFTDTLATASFGGVSFPVSSAKTPGGNDSAKHKSYGRRGADIEPLGQQEYSGTLSIPFINDLAGWEGVTLFPDRYLEFIAKVEASPIATLQHPSKGSFTAHADSWPEILVPETRNGVMIEFGWTEHNGEASTSLDFGNATQQNTPQAATQQAAAADAAITTVSLGGSSAAAASVSIASSATSARLVGGLVPVSPGVVGALAFLEASPRSPGEILGAITAMLGPIQSNLASGALATPSAYPAVAALEQLQSTVYQLRERYMAGFSSARFYTTTMDMPAWQVAQVMYGDAGKVTKLLSSNQIGDPLLIPSGTQLLIVP